MLQDRTTLRVDGFAFLLAGDTPDPKSKIKGSNSQIKSLKSVFLLHLGEALFSKECVAFGTPCRCVNQKRVNRVVGAPRTVNTR